MGSSILKGIITALFVTVLTLFAGIVWRVMNLGGVTMSQLLDIGLFASCLIGGYITAKVSGQWLLGGIVGAGYVTVGTLLLTFFLPIQAWGFIQVLAEGATIGLVAGAVGAGGAKGIGMNAWSGRRSHGSPSYANYRTNDGASRKSDWYKAEEPKEWEEEPITQWTESGEKDSEVQWSWDQEEEELKGWKEAPVNNKRIESSENNQDIQWPWSKEKKELKVIKGWKDEPITKGIKSSGNSPDVQSPWNRENNERIISGPRYEEPGYLEPTRKSASMNKGTSGRPWWEQ